MKRSLTYTMLALLAADVLTTCIFGSLGVHEANPLWADGAGAPVMTNVILSHIGAWILFAHLIQSRGKRLWPYGLICGIYGPAVAWNVAAMVKPMKTYNEVRPMVGIVWGVLFSVPFWAVVWLVLRCR